MIASNFQNFPERIPSRIKRDTNKLAICLRTQKKKKKLSKLKISTGRILTKVVESRIEEGGEGVCFEATCSFEGRFYPGPGSRNEVS